MKEIKIAINKTIILRNLASRDEVSRANWTRNEITYNGSRETQGYDYINSKEPEQHMRENENKLCDSLLGYSHVTTLY